jgi:hypothetical protein
MYLLPNNLLPNHLLSCKIVTDYFNLTKNCKHHINLKFKWSYYISVATRACLATEHKCGNGRCLKKEWLCDNYADCLDGSDEKMSLCSK